MTSKFHLSPWYESNLLSFLKLQPVFGLHTITKGGIVTKLGLARHHTAAQACDLVLCSMCCTAGLARAHFSAEVDTSRPCRCASKDELLGLREGDVTAVSQRGDAKTAAVADVLIPVHDLGVADIYLQLSASLYPCGLGKPEVVDE